MTGAGASATKGLGPTTFFLVRHASHGLLGRVLTGRVPGVGLSAAGVAEAGRLGAGLVGRGVVAVVSSPVQRALETAGVVGAALGLPVVTDGGLDEVDFGDWAGAAFSELEGAPGWKEWNGFRSMAATPGGETMLQVQSRVVAAASRLRRAYGAGGVVLVSHQDVLKALLAHWLGMPIDLMQRLEVTPASCSVVQLWDDDVRVDGVGWVFGSSDLR